MYINKNKVDTLNRILNTKPDFLYLDEGKNKVLDKFKLKFKSVHLKKEEIITKVEQDMKYYLKDKENHKENENYIGNNQFSEVNKENVNYSIQSKKECLTGDSAEDDKEKEHGREKVSVFRKANRKENDVKNLRDQREIVLKDERFDISIINNQNQLKNTKENEEKPEKTDSKKKILHIKDNQNTDFIKVEINHLTRNKLIVKPLLQKETYMKKEIKINKKNKLILEFIRKLKQISSVDCNKSVYEYEFEEEIEEDDIQEERNNNETTPMKSESDYSFISNKDKKLKRHPVKLKTYKTSKTLQMKRDNMSTSTINYIHTTKDKEKEIEKEIYNRQRSQIMTFENIEKDEKEDENKTINYPRLNIKCFNTKETKRILNNSLLSSFFSNSLLRLREENKNKSILKIEMTDKLIILINIIENKMKIYFINSLIEYNKSRQSIKNLFRLSFNLSKRDYIDKSLYILCNTAKFLRAIDLIYLLKNIFLNKKACVLNEIEVHSEIKSRIKRFIGLYSNLYKINRIHMLKLLDEVNKIVIKK